jgi:hypothetical protein
MKNRKGNRSLLLGLKSADTGTEGPLDTKAEDVQQVSFVPHLDARPLPKDILWTHKRF